MINYREKSASTYLAAQRRRDDDRAKRKFVRLFLIWIITLSIALAIKQGLL